MAPSMAITEAITMEAAEISSVVVTPCVMRKPILRAMKAKLRSKE